jgi:hypothetical protein
MDKHHRLVLLSVFAIVLGVWLPAQEGGRPTSNSRLEELKQKLAAARPKDAEFRFDPPASWGSNLMQDARLISVSTGESLADAARLIDGNPATHWQSNRAGDHPALTFNLGAGKEFNRIVVFNRFTDCRGSGDGNNATRVLEILVSDGSASDAFISLGRFSLKGPKPFCIKTDSGQMCTWIDDPAPTVLEIPETRARYLMVVLVASFWEPHVPPETCSTIALSQILLFHAK